MLCKKRTLHRLCKTWTKKLNELTKAYEKNPKKYQGALKKLCKIDNTRRDKLLLDYYEEVKKNYLILLNKYIKAQSNKVIH